MSVKSLRSNLMLDVVFNGSGSRPPSNMSEVTLTFDNADKRLPIDYSDVAITRRLFRSGESEYFINKTQCRLRDIKELFLDTGMGEDGYSSMEQGKVEWILQAKPEERRELFEEAAGVSKYRARREEALRKLDRVEIDLSRLNDIVSVTKDQIRKLENAVNRAKTYQRIREELKVAEVSDWLFQLNQIVTQADELGTRVGTNQTKIDELNTKVIEKEARIATLRLSLTTMEDELSSANQSLAAIDADIKIGEERLANGRLREADLNEKKTHLTESIAREEVRIQGLTQAEAEQDAALTTVREKGASIEADFEASAQQHEASLQTLEQKKTASKEIRDLILERAH
jgi:chromosome segregation protein